MGGVVEGEALRVSAAANGVRPAGERVTAVVVDLCIFFVLFSFFVCTGKKGGPSFSFSLPPSPSSIPRWSTYSTRVCLCITHVGASFFSLLLLFYRRCGRLFLGVIFVCTTN